MRVLEHPPSVGRARDADHLVRDQIGRDVLEVRRDQLGRAPAALRRRRDRVSVRRGRPRLLEYPQLQAQELAWPRVAVGPPARRCERDDRPGPASRRQPQRDVAAERVADDVRIMDAGSVDQLLNLVDERVVG